MRLTVASGKGGAGKTSVAVSLALCAEGPCLLLDCDVEEPNASLLLTPKVTRKEKATIPLPVVNEDMCTFCRKCSTACRFHAMMILPHKAVVFDKMCHGCGVCSFVCPEGAITEQPREIGEITWGEAEEVKMVEGRLNVGEAMAPPLIRQVKAAAKESGAGLVIRDAPPGVSCPFVETARGSDSILFVVEPTPFGYHDFELSSRVVAELGMPWGVVVNKGGEEGNIPERIAHLCQERGGTLLATIPFDEEIARGYSMGLPMVEAAPGLKPLFREMLNRLREMA